MTLAIPVDTSAVIRLAMFGVHIDAARESLARATFLIDHIGLDTTLSVQSNQLAKDCMALQMKVEKQLRAATLGRR